MAAGTDRNQQLAVIDPRLTMMHMKPIGRPACAAKSAVALENLVAETGKALARMAGAAGTGAAESGQKRKVPAAVGTEQGLLPRPA